MINLGGLVDQDLAGYRIRNFYEVQVAADEEGRTMTAEPQAFLSQELAAFRAKAGHFGKAASILVLVAESDSEEGVALTGLNAGKTLVLLNDTEEKLSAIRNIMAKLDPEERAILGYPDPDEPAT